MANKKNKKYFKHSIRMLITIVAIIILILVLVPQREQLITGLESIKKANFVWLAAAIVFLLATYLMTALIYIVLAKRKINNRMIVLVQVASSFVNRVIPAGLGGLGLNADFLLKNKHNSAESGAVVATSTFIALVSHLTLLFAALLAGSFSLKDLVSKWQLPWWAYLAGFLILLVLITVINIKKKIRVKIKKFLSAFIKNIKSYSEKPFSLLFAYFGASFVTSFFVLALFSSAKAVGMDINLIEVFMCYTVGVLVGAAVFTPGGLIGVEAGMYGAFLILGQSPATSFAAVIVYRLITYWLPIIPGMISFFYLKKCNQI